MGNIDKTKEQLIKELNSLRQKAATLEVNEAEFRKVKSELVERVKELECFYNIFSINQRPEITLDEFYEEVVKVLPASWQYPEITSCCISIGNKTFKTDNYVDTEWKQWAIIKLHGLDAGRVEVNYIKSKPEIDEGPFLKEERRLIDTVADAIGRITESRETTIKLLRQSEEKYRLLHNSTAQGVICQRNTGEMISMNPAAERILGATMEQINNLELIDANLRAIHEDGTPYPAEEHPTMVSLRTGKAVKNAVLGVYNQIDKRYRWININSVPQFIPGEGKLYQAYATFEDITALKQAEEALRKSEEFKTILLDNSPYPIVVANPDTSIKYVNSALEKLSGYSASDVVGVKVPHPWWREKAVQEANRIYQQTMLDGISGVEALLQKKNGEYFWVEVTYTPVYENGQLSYMVGSWVDIASRKEAEDLYKVLAQDLSGGVYIIQDGKFQYANGAFQDWTEYTEAEILMMNPKEFVHPEDRDVVRENAVNMLKGVISKPYEFRYVTKSGESRWVVETVSSIYYKGRRAILGNFIDITERKLMEEIFQPLRRRVQSGR